MGGETFDNREDLGSLTDTASSDQADESEIE